MNTHPTLIVLLAIASPAAALDQPDTDWWSNATISAGVLNYYTDRNDVYGAKAAATMYLDYSQNMTVSNETSTAKSVFESGMKNIISWADYTIIAQASFDNATMDLLEVGEMLDALTLQDQITNQSLCGGANRSTAT